MKSVQCISIWSELQATINFVLDSEFSLQPILKSSKGTGESELGEKGTVEGDHRGQLPGIKGDGRCTEGRGRGGREVRFPRWREVGEIGENYAKLCSIWQSKKCKGAGANKIGKWD